MKKTWTIKSIEGKKIDFSPIWEVYEKPNNEGKDVECKAVQLEIDDKKYTFNFLNLYQFMYFIANEELRQGLLQRYERRVNKIPYDVTFKLTSEEQKEGMVKRRIELTIDELTMAIARNEAFKLMPQVKSNILKGIKPWELFKKKL